MNASRYMRLGLVDDDPLTLAALRALANGWRAEHGMAVVWAVRSGDEAVDRCVDVHSRPDVVLVDMGMDGVDGAATCARIRLCSDSIVLLAITCHSLRHYRDAARRSGAQALLDKADMAGLRRCLAACAAGEPYVHDGFPSPARAYRLARAQGRTHPLSEREAEVMDWTVRGLTAREVADRMGLSESTVKTHVRHAITKLGVRGKLQAIMAWSELRRLP